MTAVAEAPPTPIRVVLLDDHEVVRSGVANLVNAHDDMEVVGEASTVRDIMSVIERTRPNVAVLDLSWMGLSRRPCCWR